VTRQSAESVATRTSAALSTLSRAERRVGRALLADYPSAGLASAARLAERAEVSPPTVLRFAQSLGFEGFTDLQVALRAELSALSSGPLNRLPDAPPQGTDDPAVTAFVGEEAHSVLGFVDDGLRVGEGVLGELLERPGR